MPREQYEFSASGHPDVVSAFRSVGQAAARSGTQVDKVFANAPKAARRSAAQVVSIEERGRQKRIRALEKESQQRARRVKAAQDKELRQLEQKLAKEGRLEERSAKAKSRSVEREAKKMQRSEARRHAQRRRAIGGALGGAGRAAIRGVGAVGGAVAGVAAAAVYSSVRLQDRSTRLAIKGGGKFSGTELRKGFERTAMEVRGTKAEDVAAGVDAFVTKTGDIDAARKFQRVFAEISVATGTAAADIGGAAADLFEKFDIKTVEGMSKAMATLAVQGKRGSFELEDAARQFPKIAAAAQRFGMGKGAEQLATLGGLTQIARRGTGSAEQAGTSVSAMFRQLIAKSPELKKQGINVFGKGGKARDIRDVLVDVISKVGGSDMEKKKVGLQKVFGDEGIGAVSALITTFADAVGEGRDGVRALRAELDKAIDATGAEAEIRRDLAMVQTTTSAKMTAAWESVKIVVGDQLAPKLAEFAGQIAGFIETTDFSALVQAFVDVTSAAMWAAEVFGLISKKDMTPQERITQANQQLERIDRVRDPLRARSLGAGAALSNVEYTQLQALDAEEAQFLKQRASATAEQEQLDQLGATKFGSKEDFIEKFKATQKPEDELAPFQVARAERIAETIISDPTARSGADSPQQAAIIQAFKDSVTQKGGDAFGEESGGPGAARGATKALSGMAGAADAVRKAANEAATALKGVKPPPATAFHDGT